MDFQLVRIKINQSVPPGSPVVSIIITTDGLAAVVGRHGIGPGGPGWIESEPMPVLAALDAAKAALASATRRPLPRRPSDVIFVHFCSDDQWDPSWGEWSWLRRSGAPIPAKRGNIGWRNRS